MKTVQILLSSYNGEKYISRQIDSILCQKDVEIHLLIRDDGSTDNTRKIIKEYEERYPSNIKVVLGENIGWKKSFFTLLTLAADDYDYYAFSDQDDYWYKDKEISSIAVMESDSITGPKLVQVDYITTDKNLRPLKLQPQARPIVPRYHDELFSEEFFQGCCMTWNYAAMQLLKRYTPKKNYGHDYWVGVVCSLFGTAYYLPVPKFLYIRYEKSVSTTGNQLAGQLARLKRFIHGDHQLYYNIGDDILKGYGCLLKDRDRKMCLDLKNYKHSIRSKMKILFNCHLRRRSIRGSLFFKFSILLNRF